MDKNLCSNCGSVLNDDSNFCSNCGVTIKYPAEKNDNNFGIFDDNPVKKVSGIISKTKEFIKHNNIRQLGAITIDVEEKRFYVSNAKIIKSKDSKSKNLARGTAALLTGGLSYIGEKSYIAAKNIYEGKQWINFSDLKGYERNIQNSRKYSGNNGRVRIAKGIWVGKSEGQSKNVTSYASLILKINSLDYPLIEIPVI